MSDNSSETAHAIDQVGRWMSEHDRFARKVGVRMVEIGPGSCTSEMVVSEDSLNAVGVTHGGAVYTLADFTFAVACNTRERVAVALTTTMVYTAASVAGDNLTARAVERSCGHRTATYDIEVTKEDGSVVGLFNGTAYRKDVEVVQFLSDQGFSS